MLVSWFVCAKLIQLGYPKGIDFRELCVDFYVYRVAQCLPVSFGWLSVLSLPVSSVV